MYMLVGRWCLTTSGVKVAVYTVLLLDLEYYSTFAKIYAPNLLHSTPE